MIPPSFLLPLRLVRRELRRGLAGFGVFLACLALGVAAVAAVGSLAAGLESGLKRDAARLLGGDLSLRQVHFDLRPDIVETLARHGQVSRFASMRAMAHLDREDGPNALVELKAVDGAYPLYGAVELGALDGSPLALSLDQALARHDGLPGAVAETGLLARLGAEVGDVITLGRERFRLTAVILKEPDKAANFFGLGPRLMIRQDDLAATGLVQPGTLLYHHARVRVRPGESADKLREELTPLALEEGFRIRGVGDAASGLARSLENFEAYLSLVGLAALLIAGLGAATAVNRFLHGRLQSLAVMKCLGAERPLLFQIYGLQVLLLALVGGVLGLIAGQATAWLVGMWLTSAMGLPMDQTPHAQPLLLALGFGLLTAAAYSLPALSAAAKASPARLFRGYADPRPARPGWKAWLGTALAALAMLGLALAGLGQPRAVLAVTAAGAFSAGLLWLLSLLARLAARLAGRVRDPRLRHGLANLTRPGAATGRVVLSLGLGLTAMSAVLLTDASQQDQLLRRIPAEAPSYFFLNAPKDRHEAFQNMLRNAEGVQRFDSEPSLRGRIVEIAGRPAEEVDIDPDVSWALRGDRGLTFKAEQPADIELTAGQWWPADYAGEPLLCFDAKIAKGFGVGVGDTLTLGIMGRRITARIACLRDIDWTTLSLNHAVILSPGVLEAAPYTYIFTAYVAKDKEAALSALAAREFPEVVQIYVADVLAEAGRVLRNIGLATRGAAGLTLVAGLLVLAEVLRANLRARRRDAVVLKVLGATRGDVLLSLLAELGFLGLITAALSALLGTALAWALVRWLLEIPWSFQPWALLLVLGLGLGATLLLGLAGVRRMLRQSSWDVLRNE